MTTATTGTTSSSKWVTANITGIIDWASSQLKSTSRRETLVINPTLARSGTIDEGTVLYTSTTNDCAACEGTGERFFGRRLCRECGGHGEIEAFTRAGVVAVAAYGDKIAEGRKAADRLADLALQREARLAKRRAREAARREAAEKAAGAKTKAAPKKKGTKKR